MTTERIKLPREEIERLCLDALKAYPHLAATTSVMVGPSRNLLGSTWDVIALVPRASMEAFTEALSAVEKLQALYDLER